MGGRGAWRGMDFTSREQSAPPLLSRYAFGIPDPTLPTPLLLLSGTRLATPHLVLALGKTLGHHIIASILSVNKQPIFSTINNHVSSERAAARALDATTFDNT